MADKILTFPTRRAPDRCLEDLFVERMRANENPRLRSISEESLRRGFQLLAKRTAELREREGDRER